jgi:16S rRNA (cytosine1402-N4)-methyltransferase
MEFCHIPVMLEECVEGLKINPGGIYLDGTFGGGGHGGAILERLGANGVLIAADKDGEALENAEKINDKRIKIFNCDFKEVLDKLKAEGIGELDGVLLDLGVSSYQLDNADRGFSYKENVKLDMRMNRAQKLSAYEVVNGYSQSRLEEILRDFGEERFYKKIAANIVWRRAKAPISTSGELAEIIKESIPRKLQKDGNPCKRSFMAVRIEVNGELEGLREAAEALAMSLKSGGRMCVLTFHSLEDREIKNAFKNLSAECICDKSLPKCVCNNKPKIKIINNKPLTASIAELNANSRSASAKLRIIERL